MFSVLEHPRRIRESRVKERHRRMFLLLADNLANYFRVLLETSPERFREELARLEKG